MSKFHELFDGSNPDLINEVEGNKMTKEELDAITKKGSGEDSMPAPISQAIDVPHRSVRLTLAIEADTLGELAMALNQIAMRADRGELMEGVSGGASSGYIYELLHLRTVAERWVPGGRGMHTGHNKSL